MKKVIALALVAIMLFGLTACGKDKKKSTAKTDPNKITLPDIEHETVYDGNAAYLPYADGVFSTEYDDEADKKRQEITDYKDSKVPYDNVYYISYRGDDTNDGKSPNTPWKTNLNLKIVPTKSAILFERGGVYRFQVEAKADTYYGAYGEGAKPFLYGSPKNYADESLWTQYKPNIWKASTGLSADIDIGGITFDHGKKAAVRMQQVSVLYQDYMYFYAQGAVYLYLSKGNPASIHKDIEFTILGAGIHLGKNSNITIENIGIKYNNFGIGTSGNNNNITLKGLEIGYIGGCQRDGTRWGNGVEFWGSCSNVVLEDCWIYQCYDAGITHQYSKPTTFENISFSNNLIEFCQYPIEFFNGTESGNIAKNIKYEKNIIRFAGYQVFDPKDRLGSSSSATSSICMWSPRQFVLENFVITGNIFDTSYGYLIYVSNYNQTNGPKVYGNYYLQRPQLSTYYWDVDQTKTVPSVVPGYEASNQSTFETGVKALDTAPKKITFKAK